MPTASIVASQADMAAALVSEHGEDKGQSNGPSYGEGKSQSDKTNRGGKGPEPEPEPEHCKRVARVGDPAVAIRPDPAVAIRPFRHGVPVRLERTYLFPVAGTPAGRYTTTSTRLRRSKSGGR